MRAVWRCVGVTIVSSILTACGGGVTGPTGAEETPILTASVSERYGGAIVELRTPWGNVLDSSNGGTLLSTAIWTLPIDPRQTAMCPAPPCEGTVPFLNPTQGGYLGDGHAGNPYGATVTRGPDGEIVVSYRAVNYNYGWPTLDRAGWETDWFGDVVIRQRDARSLSVKTRITYCKQGGCAPAVTQDNQLSTAFGRGQSHPDPAERGAFVVAEVRGSEGCILDTGGRGVCLSVRGYVPHAGFGVATTTWPSVAFIQPELERFRTSGVERVEVVTIDGFAYVDIPRYRFAAGGWYEFETIVRIEGA